MLPSRRSQNIAVVQPGCSRNWTVSEIGLWFIGWNPSETENELPFGVVVPAKAGIQVRKTAALAEDRGVGRRPRRWPWTPAYAGVTIIFEPDCKAILSKA